MNPLTCSRCGASRDTADNFCRHCGHQLTVNLPALSRVEGPARRPANLPAPIGRGAIPPSLVGSVAVLALGTGLEWLARRLAGSAARAAGRALAGERPLPAKRVSSPPDSIAVDEVLYVRKVQLRR